MYMKRMVEIGKADNGYVIEVRVKFKPKKKGKGDDIIREYPGSSEKQFVAKDLKEVNSIISQIMPLLEEEFTSEDEFNAAFSEAAK